MNMTLKLSNTCKRALFFLFATSGLVFVEPAPFDILFVLTFVVFAATKVWCLPQGIGATSAVLLVFCLLSLVSVPFTIIDFAWGMRFYAITTYLALLAIFVGGMIGTYGEDAARPIFHGMVFSFVLSLFFAYLSLAGILPFKDVVTFYGGRFRGFFKDGNVLGPTLVGMMIYVVHHLRVSPPLTLRGKAYYALAFVMFFLGAALTYSRSTWGILVAALLLYYMLSTGRRAARNVLLILPVVGILAGVTYFIAEAMGYGDILRQRASMQSYDTGRFYVYGLLWDEAFRRPLGIGPGQTDLLIRSYFGNVTALGSASAQNTVLRILIEHGFYTALAFIVYTVACLKQGLALARARWPHAGLAAACFTMLVAYFVCSLVIDTLHWRVLWIFSGAVMGLHALHVKYQREVQGGAA